ncbi:hypothetical protein SLA2020_278710 [Shorea laevis]
MEYTFHVCSPIIENAQPLGCNLGSTDDSCKLAFERTLKAQGNWISWLFPKLYGKVQHLDIASRFKTKKVQNPSRVQFGEGEDPIPALDAITISDNIAGFMGRTLP